MVSFLSNEATLHFDESIQPLFFLKPSSPNDGPTRDTVVDGLLILTIPRAREVKEITVEFYGKQSMWVAGRHETYETIRKSLTLTPGWLEQGEHRFQWSFIVPSNTAGFEVCKYGRTSHHCRATAVGCGRFGKDLVADSLVDLVADSNEPGIAEGYDKSRELYHEVLGPLRGRLHSKYLLRGGYIRFALAMPAVSKKVRIEDVQVVLGQEFNLQSMKNPNLTEHCSGLVPLWSLKREGIAPLTLEKDQELNLVRQVRLMAENDHDEVRPTTNDCTETGIRVAHQLFVVIRFRPLEDNPNDDVKELKMPFTARLSSCASNVENFQLPHYGASLVDTKKFRKTTHMWRLDCLCHRPTTAELLAIYGSDLKADAEDQYGHEVNRQPPWASKPPPA